MPTLAVRRRYVPIRALVTSATICSLVVVAFSVSAALGPKLVKTRYTTAAEYAQVLGCDASDASCHHLCERLVGLDKQLGTIKADIAAAGKKVSQEELGTTVDKMLSALEKRVAEDLTIDEKTRAALRDKVEDFRVRVSFWRAAMADYLNSMGGKVANATAVPLEELVGKVQDAVRSGYLSAHAEHRGKRLDRRDRRFLSEASSRLMDSVEEFRDLIDEHLASAEIKTDEAATAALKRARERLDAAAAALDDVSKDVYNFGDRTRLALSEALGKLWNSIAPASDEAQKERAELSEQESVMEAKAAKVFGDKKK